MKKKGFTLIELLAVIVILAVIALIATPIIMNVINDSKKGAAKDAMYGYVKAVELASINTVTATIDAPDGNYTTENGNIKKGSEVIEVLVKGTKPKNGGTVVLSKGNVSSATLEFDGILVIYDGKKAEVGEGSTPTPTATPEINAFTEGDIIYYNPETNKKCTAGEVNTAVNAKTGCMIFNVVTMGDEESKTTIDIMIDHNTTRMGKWNSTGSNTEMKEAAEALQADVATWDASVKSTARLITGQEVANIGRDAEWTSTNITNTKYPEQSWLFKNTHSNGDDTNYGYWTSTANPSKSDRVWFVFSKGYLNDFMVDIGVSCGIRPVITIAKDIIL